MYIIYEYKYIKLNFYCNVTHNTHPHAIQIFQFNKRMSCTHLRRYSNVTCIYQLAQIFQGNTNTHTAELREVDPPVIARRLRLVPYSTHPKVVCLRAEFYGCTWQGEWWWLPRKVNDIDYMTRWVEWYWLPGKVSGIDYVAWWVVLITWQGELSDIDYLERWAVLITWYGESSDIDYLARWVVLITWHGE